VNSVKTTGYIRLGMSAVAVGGAVVLVWLSLGPIAAASSNYGNESIRRLPVIDLAARDTQGLVRQVAGRRLIEPPQIQAAVRDTGAAQRLLKQLTLQGVVNLGGTMVAYIGVRNGNVQTLPEGGKVLQFVVKEIQPGHVTLTLDGVDVMLTH